MSFNSFRKNNIEAFNLSTIYGGNVLNQSIRVITDIPFSGKFKRFTFGNNAGDGCDYQLEINGTLVGPVLNTPGGDITKVDTNIKFNKGDNINIDINPSGIALGGTWTIEYEKSL